MKKVLLSAMLVVSSLVIAVPAAQAQYPYSWSGATPPSWFTDSIEPSCQPRENHAIYNDADTDQPLIEVWSLYWEESRATCSQQTVDSTDPEWAMACEGYVNHGRWVGTPPPDATSEESYDATWLCHMGGRDRGTCERKLWYSSPPSAEDYDSMGWVGEGLQSGCPPRFPGDPVPPSDGDGGGGGGIQTIIKGKSIRKRTAKFRFSSNIPAATFECKLKGKRSTPKQRSWSVCASPKKYKGLKPGKYAFKVRARGDSTPAKAKFKVVK